MQVMRVILIFSTIIQSYPNGRKPIQQNWNNLIAFQTYTIADSKKNRVLVFEIWKGS